MGHERVGFLPKTQKWRAIVQDIAATERGDLGVDELAQRTLQALGSRYTTLASDPSVSAAYEFLVEIALAARTAPESLHGQSPLQLASTLQERLARVSGSLETREIVRRATAETLAEWARENVTSQVPLFSHPPELSKANLWQPLGQASNFSDLSRFYFAKLTERYLRYFLEREASAQFSSLAARERFQSRLSAHVAGVAKHAFESSKITQSFAAGWFTKRTREGVPSKAATRRFLEHAFQKLREEFRRESKA
jgi:hypothetical protein